MSCKNKGPVNGKFYLEGRDSLENVLKKEGLKRALKGISSHSEYILHSCIKVACDTILMISMFKFLL